jgi:hypothetical protein
MMINYNENIKYTIKDLTIDDMVNLIGSVKNQILINNLSSDNAKDYRKDIPLTKLYYKTNESLIKTLVKVHKALGDPQ